MKQYTIKISETDGGYPKLITEFSTIKLFGFIGENRARELIFERSDIETGIDRMGDNLVLYFKDENQEFPPITLGTENNYVITNALTQTEKTSLQIAYVHDDIETERSNWIHLRLGKSIGVFDPLEPIPDPLDELRSKAWASKKIAVSGIDGSMSRTPVTLVMRGS